MFVSNIYNFTGKKMSLEKQIKHAEKDLEKAQYKAKQKQDALFILLLEAKKRGIKPLNSKTHY